MLTYALVTRLIFDGKRVTGVEVLVDDQRRQFTARCETVLSLGAINTPKLLMQSGIGPEGELQAHGIPVVQHLPGVGRNHQDHLAFGCTWAYRKSEAVGGSGCEAKLSGKPTRGLRSRTFFSASWSSLCRPRSRRASKHRNMAGRCLAVSPSQKAVVDCGSPAPI